jgi:hypothetical protein
MAEIEDWADVNSGSDGEDSQKQGRRKRGRGSGSNLAGSEDQKTRRLEKNR